MPGAAATTSGTQRYKMRGFRRVGVRRDGRTGHGAALTKLTLNTSAIPPTTRRPSQSPPSWCPYLRQAMALSPSELIFPAPDGSMMSEEINLELVLRLALGRAGIVTGHRHQVF